MVDIAKGKFRTWFGKRYGGTNVMAWLSLNMQILLPNEQ